MDKAVLILKTGNTIPQLQAEGVDFEDWFQAGMGLSKSQICVVAVHEGEDLPNIATVSAVVITGSPAYVTDLAPWNYIAAEFIKEAFDAKLPMMGVCYGHQLIAWAFGGRVDFHPLGREIGTVTLSGSEHVGTDKLLAGLPKTMEVNVSHQQSVIDLPVGAVPLYSNDFDPNHGFRLGEQTWCFQFHPEFDQTITRAYIQARQDEINKEGLDAEKLLAGVTETPESADILRRFRDIVRNNEVR